MEEVEDMEDKFWGDQGSWFPSSLPSSLPSSPRASPR